MPDMANSLNFNPELFFCLAPTATFQRTYQDVDTIKESTVNIIIFLKWKLFLRIKTEFLTCYSEAFLLQHQSHL
jgi:hypothetical protein